MASRRLSREVFRTGASILSILSLSILTVPYGFRLTRLRSEGIDDYDRTVRSFQVPRTFIDGAPFRSCQSCSRRAGTAPGRRPVLVRQPPEPACRDPAQAGVGLCD